MVMYSDRLSSISVFFLPFSYQSVHVFMKESVFLVCLFSWLFAFSVALFSFLYIFSWLIYVCAFFTKFSFTPLDIM